MNILAIAPNQTNVAIERTAVGAADYNPSALTTDRLIAVDNTAAARAVTISTEDEDTGTTTNPRIFVIKDQSMVTCGVDLPNEKLSV